MHLTAEQFYTQRDARTTGVADTTGLSSAIIEISIDEREAVTFSGQLAFLLLVNISARWCRTILLRAPNAPLVSAVRFLGNERLLDCALNMARRADPFGIFIESDNDSSPSISIHVGAQPISSRLCVLGRGWQAELGLPTALDLPQSDIQNPLGPALAACLGACYVMRRALCHENLCKSAKLSLWNFASGSSAIDGPALSSFDIGRVLLVGTGAVGASIACLFPFVPIRFSDLVLLDSDRIECSNLNRVPIFFAEDIGLPKVMVTSDYLRATGIKSQPIGQWFNEAIVSKFTLQEFDVVIPVADEQGVRHSIQSNCPPLMIHGSTGNNWDAFSGRHIPLLDDCMDCRFPEQGAKTKCAQGSLETTTVKNKQTNLTGALPFLSLAAATLALSELLKLGYTNYPMNPNSTILSFKAPEMRFMVVDRYPRPDCGVCRDQDTWRAVTGQSKFASLSIRRNA